MIFFRRSKKQFGISLIEVMIGVAIVSALFAWFFHSQRMSVNSINYTVAKTRVNGLVQELLSRISMNKSNFNAYESVLNGNMYSCASLVNCIGRTCTSSEMVTFDIQQVMCNTSELKDFSMTLSCATSSCTNNATASLKASWGVYEGESANGDNGLKTHELTFNMSFLDGDYLPVGSQTDSVYTEPEDETVELEGAPDDGSDDGPGGSGGGEGSGNSGGILITEAQLLDSLDGSITAASIQSVSSDSGIIFDNQDGTFTLIPGENFDGSDIGLNFEVDNGEDVTNASASIVNSQELEQFTFEDFESGISGWEGDNVYSEDSGDFDTGTAMGMDSLSGLVSKEFTVPDGAESVVLTFSAHEVESWDAEKFQVYINDDLFVEEVFEVNDNALGTDVLLNQAGQEVGSVVHAEEGNFIGYDEYREQSHAFTMEVPVNLETGKVKIGFDSTLNGENSEERFQIDNLALSTRVGWEVQ